VKDKHLRVVAVGGNHRLGGADWDSVIVTYFEKEFELQKNISVDVLEGNLETRQQLLNEAERTKIGLSTVNKRDYRIRHEAESAMVSLSREKLDELTAPLLDMTISLTKNVLERAAKKGFKKIDTLLLVGGSTYMPHVEDRLRREFPSSRLLRQEPNLIVAKGAALFGHKLQIDKEILNRIGDLTGAHPDAVDLDRVAVSVKNQAQQSVAMEHGIALPDLRRLHEKTITNVTAKSFGLKTWDRDTRHEFITNLIMVDDPVPKTFTTNRFTLDNRQSSVDLEVWENISRTGPEERLDLGKCTLIGQALLRFQRPLPANSEIEVTFDLSPDGLLRMHGRDLTTHAEVTGEFKTEGAMTPQQVDDARERAMAMPVS
jgi:molecular chaperone DnaK